MSAPGGLLRRTAALCLLASAGCRPAAPEASEGTAATVPDAASAEGAPASAPAAEVPAPTAELRAALERSEAERAACAERAAGLEAEVAKLQEARLAREQEWLRYQKALAKLDVSTPSDAVEFVPDVPAGSEAADDAPPAAGGAGEPSAAAESPEFSGSAEPGEPGEPTASTDRSDRAGAEAERARRAARAEEIGRTLHSLLTIEEVHALDLLEVGSLGDGWVGPVVFRILDAQGRLAGSLFAERLHLEGSRAGRTLTLVLEDGHENRGGQSTPFAAPNPLQPGERRIVLPYVDPEPWARALPELFADHPLDVLHDDGTWNLTLLRGTLNQLLREDAALGWYRLRGLGGVTAGVLRDVRLEEFDAAGRSRRHLFADRVEISLEEPGVVLLLEGGASMQGQDKTPFPDGTLRLYLPRARHEAWSADRVPLYEEPAIESGDDGGDDGEAAGGPPGSAER